MSCVHVHAPKIIRIILNTNKSIRIILLAFIFPASSQYSPIKLKNNISQSNSFGICINYIALAPEDVVEICLWVI